MPSTRRAGLACFGDPTPYTATYTPPYQTRDTTLYQTRYTTPNPKLPMKKLILSIILLGLVAVSTTSCNLNADDLPGMVMVSPPDPVKVLEDRLEAERELREEAQAQADSEALLRERWQLAAIGLGVVALVGFLAGTSIGSRGKRHAAIA